MNGGGDTQSEKPRFRKKRPSPFPIEETPTPIALSLSVLSLWKDRRVNGNTSKKPQSMPSLPSYSAPQADAPLSAAPRYPAALITAACQVPLILRRLAITLTEQRDTWGTMRVWKIQKLIQTQQ